MNGKIDIKKNRDIEERGTEIFLKKNIHTSDSFLFCMLLFSFFSFRISCSFLADSICFSISYIMKLYKTKLVCKATVTKNSTTSITDLSLGQTKIEIDILVDVHF